MTFEGSLSSLDMSIVSDPRAEQKEKSEDTSVESAGWTRVLVFSDSELARFWLGMLEQVIEGKAIPESAVNGDGEAG